MLIQNHCLTPGSVNSELHPQVCRFLERPTKVKSRHFEPDVYSLLVDDSRENRRRKISVHCPAEESKSTGMTHKYDVGEEEDPCWWCSCERRSHRTEDIFVREDEDGARSHFCPLEESEPDQPMVFDAYLFMRDLCTLRSEDIPCLVAERPILESEEENPSSDVDASVSMIYAPPINRQQAIDADSLNCLRPPLLLGDRKTRLEEDEIMAAWLEEDVAEKELEKEDESDTEEFEGNEPTVEERLECSSERDARGAISEISSTDAPSSVTATEDDFTTDGKSNTDRNRVSDVAKSRLIISSERDIIDNYEYMKNKREHNSQNDCRPHESSGQNASRENVVPDYPPDRKEDDPSLPVTDEGFGASRVERTLQNVSIHEKKTTPRSNLSLETRSLEDTGVETDNKTGDNWVETPREETDPSEKMGVLDMSDDSALKNWGLDILTDLGNAKEYAQVKSDEKEKQDWALETGVLDSPETKTEEVRDDLATALRFMTDVYGTKEEESFSDRLSIADILSEMSTREKTDESASDVHYKDISGEGATGHPTEITAPGKSGHFEPMTLTEGQGTVKRPRNKFSKFFQSVKKIVAKKQ